MKASFKIDSVEAAAAAISAGRRIIAEIVAFMISFGALFRMPDPEEDRAAYDAAHALWADAKDTKATTTAAMAKYRAARLPLIAADYDGRHGGRNARKSLALDGPAARALPENDPVKIARAALQNTARQDVWYIRNQHRILVDEAFRLRDEALTPNGTPSPKASKTLLETFDQFAKDSAARNQRNPEVNAGDLSLILAAWRDELTAKLPQKLKLKD
jgi:hypothetical protein